MILKLLDFEPEWLSNDVFIFRSPNGNCDLLTCKRVVMPMKEQYALIYKANPQYIGKAVVMTKPDFAWSFIVNNFETLTVSPSVDASASGNWHGFIRNGQIS